MAQKPVKGRKLLVQSTFDGSYRETGMGSRKAIAGGELCVPGRHENTGNMDINKLKVPTWISATVLGILSLIAISALISRQETSDSVPSSVVAQPEAIPNSTQSKTQMPPPAGIVFDLRAIASKISYTNIKSMLGSPTREGIPDPLLDLDGWAEWDKDGLTLAIQYGRTGILKNNKVAGCAISLFPKKGFLSEDQLRQAGNLPKGNSFIVEDKQVGILFTFTIKPAYNIYNKLYAIEVCP